jgi:hypothetical protein
MDPMLTIPQNRKRLSVVRLCLIMGMTALLLITVVNRLGSAAQAVLLSPHS